MTTTQKSPRTLSWSNPLDSVEAILTDSKYFNLVAGLLLLAESALNILIIHRVAYTEIDWTTYMQQVTTFLAGQRNYSLIKGSTGPIVYPAGFLYAYSALYYLTNEGKDIRRAQYIFAGIYVATMGCVFEIYRRCRSVPPYALVLLTLSKRLHSIYVLRLFNDGIAMLLFYIAVLALTAKRPHWSISAILFSFALSIKMNILLFVPALLYIYYISLGPVSTILHLVTISTIQVSLAAPFLSNPREYFSTAFNFSREFDWEWTVNWRWLGQELFESEALSKGLLALHFAGLLLCLWKWSEREGGVWGLFRRGMSSPMRGAALGRSRPSPRLMVQMLFSSNLLGITFARSLHYQFYAWYAHQIVFLVWSTPFDIVPRIALLAMIEYGFSTFPSTLNSSMGLTFANLFLFAGAYYGMDALFEKEKKGGPAQKKDD